MLTHVDTHLINIIIFTLAYYICKYVSLIGEPVILMHTKWN